MNIDDALDLIHQMSSTGVTVTLNQGAYTVGGKSWIHGKADFDRANKIALDTVADHAAKRVKRFLSAPFSPASLPGEPPASRTGTLRDSIHWREGKESRQFPGPSSQSPQAMARFQAKSPKDYDWYKRILREGYENNSIITPYPRKTRGSSVVRIIEVNPRAADRSDRQRLEYYSYFLETGWWSRSNSMFKDKGTSKPTKVQVARSKANKGQKRTGPKWNPPRPYLQRLTWPVYVNELQQVYRNALKQNLPAAMHAIADKAVLKVSSIRSLRIPFVSDNKHLL